MITIFITFGTVVIRCILTLGTSDCELFSYNQMVAAIATAETIFEIGILRILRKKGK